MMSVNRQINLGRKGKFYIVINGEIMICFYCTYELFVFLNWFPDVAEKSSKRG